MCTARVQLGILMLKCISLLMLLGIALKIDSLPLIYGMLRLHLIHGCYLVIMQGTLETA